MSTKIEFNYEGKDYTLEYNRDSIRFIEKQGFDLNEFASKPMTMISLAFEGAFIKNHRNIKAATVKEIFDRFSKKEDLSDILATMISETYNTLFDSEENDDGKNIEWKAV